MLVLIKTILPDNNKLRKEYSSRIKSTKNRNYLRMFFTAKTHKEDVPFRSIISQKGTWQEHAGFMLQRVLNALPVSDPFLVRNSQQCVDRLNKYHATHMKFVSFDISDMYYNLGPDLIRIAVESAVGRLGIANFMNSTQLQLSDLMWLLHNYLLSTVVEDEGSFYRQAKGVCIGSNVAPVISDLCLSYVDNWIKDEIKKRNLAGKGFIIRYVDDYLLGYEQDATKEIVEEIFRSNPFGLTFTTESPENGRLQFLDLCIQESNSATCWLYKQRSTKPLLPFESSHSRTVKEAITQNLLRSACQRSCHHLTKEAIGLQVQRLRTSGYPMARIQESARKVFLGLTEIDRREKREKCKERPAVIPYYHGISHRLKKVALRFDREVVFRYPNKLSTLPIKVNRPERERVQDVNVIYNIPLLCGKKYVGQTGRELEKRLAEHTSDLRRGENKTIPSHCKLCKGCRPLFEETHVLERHPTQAGRELLEAFFIRNEPDRVISSPSVVLEKEEFQLIRAHLNQKQSQSLEKNTSCKNKKMVRH